MNPQPPWPDEICAADFTVERYEPCREDDDGNEIPGPEIFGAYTDDWGIASPFGGPGDRVWVRETWGYFGGDEYIYQRAIESVGYKATHDPLKPIPGGKWRPSIHMPRWASRLTLEITKVRVERVQEISHHDAVAEGVQYDVSKPDGSPLCRFQKLWESLHGKGSWDANPWVWVYDFTPDRSK